VEILERPGEWKDERILRSSGSERVLSWGRSVSNALKRKQDVKMNDDLQKIARRFGRLLTLLMIRRLPSMNWFGTPCMKLPSHEVRDVNCPIVEKYREMQAELKDRTARRIKEELKARVDV
jgi:hypothetical protein